MFLLGWGLSAPTTRCRYTAALGSCERRTTLVLVILYRKAALERREAPETKVLNDRDAGSSGYLSSIVSRTNAFDSTLSKVSLLHW